MPLGNTEPFLLNVKTQNKAATATIPLGKVAIRSDAITPNGWILCASAAPDGPFCVAVNALAAETDTTFAAAFAPSEVIMKAGAAIQPGSYVVADNAGDVIAYTEGTQEIKIVGRYIAKEGENNPTAAADDDYIRVRLGL